MSDLLAALFSAAGALVSGLLGMILRELRRLGDKVGKLEVNKEHLATKAELTNACNRLQGELKELRADLQATKTELAVLKATVMMK